MVDERFDFRTSCMLAAGASRPAAAVASQVGARFRHVSSDAAKERIVKYSDLRPLTDPRPVHSSANIAISDVKPDDFVFFSREGKVGVLGGL